MGLFSNIFGGEPDLENMTVDQMVHYTDKLSSWIDENNLVFNPSEEIKKERAHKQALLEKAMVVWQRKIKES
jgi:hypothetical protein